MVRLVSRFGEVEGVLFEVKDGVKVVEKVGSKNIGVSEIVESGACDAYKAVFLVSVVQNVIEGDSKVRKGQLNGRGGSGPSEGSLGSVGTRVSGQSVLGQKSDSCIVQKSSKDNLVGRRVEVCQSLSGIYEPERRVGEGSAVDISAGPKHKLVGIGLSEYLLEVSLIPASVDASKSDLTGERAVGRDKGESVGAVLDNPGGKKLRGVLSDIFLHKVVAQPGNKLFVGHLGAVLDPGYGVGEGDVHVSRLGGAATARDKRPVRIVVEKSIERLVVWIELRREGNQMVFICCFFLNFRTAPLYKGSMDGYRTVALVHLVCESGFADPEKEKVKVKKRSEPEEHFYECSTRAIQRRDCIPTWNCFIIPDSAPLEDLFLHAFLTVRVNGCP
ncbi:uncharacterized protein YALI1_A04385g [Yarrowia lipolytica]|uniref:Uncharacterized protein n=1 Tax=Yarrowia lipolytica TaxID=4952 RepID=A0A1D8N3Q5_YARLL|nr:hypothetical protein YALI1_A04385g [Yarrowia lipolytica]